MGVRVRPQIDKNNEKFDIEAAVKFDDCTVMLSNVGSGQVQAKRQAFTFDYIWDRDNSQEDIYEEGVCPRPLLYHPLFAPPPLPAKKRR